MRDTLLLLALASTCPLGAGCAAPTATTGLAVTPPAHLAVRPITDEEIARIGVTTAWEAIERLRPNWLRQRATSAWGTGLPMVYVNSMRQGTAEELHWIHVQRVARIVFYKSGDATTLWGTDHPNGAIQIIEYR